MFYVQAAPMTEMRENKMPKWAILLFVIGLTPTTLNLASAAEDVIAWRDWVDPADIVLGVFTDGDLRRTLDQDVAVRDTTVASVMTPGFASVVPEMLAAEALQLMESRRINALPVVNPKGALVGALNMHDLLLSGVA